VKPLDVVAVQVIDDPDEKWTIVGGFEVEQPGQ
jgi:hypothetical protein